MFLFDFHLALIVQTFEIAGVLHLRAHKYTVCFN